MGNITPPAPGNFHLGQRLAARFKEQHLRLRICVCCRDRPKEPRRPTANHPNFHDGPTCLTRLNQIAFYQNGGLGDIGNKTIGSTLVDKVGGRGELRSLVCASRGRSIRNVEPFPA